MNHEVIFSASRWDKSAAGLKKFILPAILLIAFLLRIYHIENRSLWLDELGQVIVAQDNLANVVVKSANHVGSTPLDYIVTHFVLSAIGKSDGILRLPAIVYGVLSVLTIYFLAKELFGEPTGSIAAFLLAIIPLHIYYSREVRFYSLAVLMALLTTWSLIRAVRTNSRNGWIIYSILLVLGFYSHYYLLIVSSAHGVWLLWHKKLENRIFLRFLLSNLIAFLAFLPYATYDNLIRKTNQATFSLGNLTWFTVVNSVIFPFQFAYYNTNFGYKLLWSGIVSLSILVALGLILYYRKKHLPSQYQATSLLMLIFMMGNTGVIVLDVLTKYFFNSRQFVVFLPFFVILLAHLVAISVDGIRQKIASSKSVFLPIILLAIVLSSMFYSFFPFYRVLYSLNKADLNNFDGGWGETSRAVLHASNPGDTILITPNTEFVLFYAPELEGQVSAFHPEDDINELLKRYESADRIWIVAGIFHYLNNPTFRNWVNSVDPIDISPYPNSVKLFVYSFKYSRSELLAQVLAEHDYSAASLVNSTLIEQSLADGLYASIRPIVMDEVENPGNTAGDKSVILHHLASGLLQKNEINKAIPLLEQAIQYDPRNPSAWVSLGEAYQKEGAKNAAIEAYQHSLRLAPEDYFANHFLASLLSQEATGTQDWKKIISLEKIAIAHSPGNTETIHSLLLLAKAYNQLGERTEACREISNAETINGGGALSYDWTCP